MINSNITKKAITGIILSGGFSNRFQQLGKSWQDKALLQISKDESLLERIITNISEICSEIIIITNNQNQKLLYTEAIKKLPGKVKELIRVEIDDSNILCSGPARGLISAFKFISNQFVIVTPVDVPLINKRVFLDLIENLDNYSISVPYWQNGKIEPLIFAFNYKKLQTVLPLLAFNERSRADDIFRLVTSIIFISIEPSKNNLAKNIFISINNRQDFNKLKDRLPLEEISLFNFKNNIKHKREPQIDLDIKIHDYFKENSFKKINEEIMEKGLLLSKEFFNCEMYYQAGFLLAFLLNSSIQNEDFLNSKSYNKLSELAIKYFQLEAEKWMNLNIKFLALHAYSDAHFISLVTDSELKNNLFKKITNLRNELQLEQKQHKDFTFSSLVSNKLPNFLTKAHKLIHDAEADYNENTPQFETDFLWDHSFRVGKIAYYIAIQDGVNPFVPTIAAILHDTGKFVLGKYHADDVSEESYSSKIAEKLLIKESLSKQDIKQIQNAISGLYNDNINCDINCQIVHDADRLDKLGVFGIANYFTKMTLRGNNLSDSIIRNLSRELTYASAAPKTMLTKTGKSLALLRKKQTMDYFKELLDEIQFYDLGKFYIKNFELN
ncbi:MAG: HD domain-containing protein [Asgard group archaeon]|nr:HD domain-containing protein [Asgard group archaeon]